MASTHSTWHRAFLTARRRQNRFPHCELEEASEHLPTASLELQHLDSAQVLSALAKVEDVFQPAVALFYLEDYSYKDIAEVLGVPVGTVKSRIARGLAQLRESFSMDSGISARDYEPRDLNAAHVQEPIGSF
jgi:RNA polymerase sigma-70 factor (ECF subfamily)